jgi:hypothetical protein
MSVSEVDELDAEEYDSWVAYFTMYPPPDDRNDMYMSLLIDALAKVNGCTTDLPIPLIDYEGHFRKTDAKSIMDLIVNAGKAHA